MIYHPERFADLSGDNGEDAYFEACAYNWKMLRLIDAQAKAKGDFLYRYLTQRLAAGQAVYQITAQRHSNVHIALVTGIGDDIAFPLWGVTTYIPKQLAISMLEKRDRLHRLFNSHTTQEKSDAVRQAVG